MFCNSFYLCVTIRKTLSQIYNTLCSFKHICNIYLSTTNTLKYNKIKELLTEKGLTFTALAEKIGVSRAGLYHTIENNTLSVSTLEKIAEVLEVPVTVFFENSSSDELQKKELELSKMLLLKTENNFTELKALFENQKEVSELNKKLAESATREASANYNIICMLYSDVFHLYLEIYQYVEQFLILKVPELDNNEIELKKLVENDLIIKECLTILHKIRPIIKGEIELKIHSITEIDTE